MGPILHNFDQARRDLFPRRQGLDELVPEQFDELERIGARDGDKQAFGRNEAVGDQTMEMRMKPGGIKYVGDAYPKEFFPEGPPKEA
jgi:hypothetical protein